ncbi:hypothetical protein LCGC14_2295500, partial [marine sediment metagenome]
MTFTSTVVDPNASWVGFDPQVLTLWDGVNSDMDGIDANFVENVTIAKVGTSTWAVTSVPKNFPASGTIEVAEGTMELVGTNTLGGHNVRVAGGILNLLGADSIGTSLVEMAGGILKATSDDPPPAAPPSANLEIHLDAGSLAGDGLGDNDPVNLWTDQSGKGHNAWPADAINAPLYVESSAGLNGQPAVRFDGLDDGLELGDLSANFPTAATLFIVATINNDSAYNLFDTFKTDGNVVLVNNVDGWWRWDGNGYA